MNSVVNVLFWPVSVLLHAVVGVFYPAKTQKTARYQRIARLSLLGSVVIFMTIPLSLIVTPVIGIKPPVVLGVVLLFVFVLIGNLCDDQAEDENAEHDFPGVGS
jgi:hypothetical protein